MIERARAMDPTRGRLRFNIESADAEERSGSARGGKTASEGKLPDLFPGGRFAR